MAGFLTLFCLQLCNLSLIMIWYHCRCRRWRLLEELCEQLRRLPIARPHLEEQPAQPPPRKGIQRVGCHVQVPGRRGDDKGEDVGRVGALQVEGGRGMEGDKGQVPGRRGDDQGKDVGRVGALQVGTGTERHRRKVVGNRGLPSGWEPFWPNREVLWVAIIHQARLGSPEDWIGL